jgi:hypothetical protein
MPRRAILVTVLALLAGACGQTAPERSPLPATPGDFGFSAATTPPATTAAPGSPTTTPAEPAECTVITASGANVLSTDSSFDAANSLAAGDEITAVDDVAVGSAEGLVAALADRRPGDRVSLEFRRAGASQSAEVILGAAEDDPERGRLGVEVATEFTRYPVAELPDLPIGPNPLLAELDDSIFFLDPALPAWRRSPAPALGSTIVLLDGEAFARRFGTAELISLRTAEPLLLPIGEKGLLQILGVAGGDLLVATGTVDGSEVVDPEVVSIDVGTMEVLWTTELPEFEGNPVIPRLGWVSPDGALLAVTSRADEVRLHSLLTTAGEIVAGWGAADTPFVRSDAAIGGWLDGTRVGYAFRDDTAITLGVHDVAAADGDLTVPLPGIAAVNQLAVVPTTGTAILSTPAGSALIDMNTGAAIHEISSGCAPVVVLATGG